MSEKLTEEEHIARAMLMGMCYHHGNGEPFYFKDGSDGIPDMMTFIDACTLEPLCRRDPETDMVLVKKGKPERQHKAIWTDWGKGIKP